MCKQEERDWLRQEISVTDLWLKAEAVLPATDLHFIVHYLLPFPQGEDDSQKETGSKGKHVQSEIFLLQSS